MADPKQDGKGERREPIEYKGWSTYVVHKGAADGGALKFTRDSPVAEVTTAQAEVLLREQIYIWKPNGERDTKPMFGRPKPQPRANA